MNLSELAVEVAALTALKKTVDDRLADVRAAMQCELTDNGVRTVDATLPDGTKVATISRSQPKPTATVTDEKAFTKWVRETAPTEVVSRVVTEVRVAHRTALLAEMTKTGTAEITDTETGEIHAVPGVTVAAPRSATHTVRLTDDGRAAIAAAWRAGHLDLPQLAAGGGEQP